LGVKVTKVILVKVKDVGAAGIATAGVKVKIVLEPSARLFRLVMSLEAGKEVVVKEVAVEL